MTPNSDKLQRMVDSHDVVLFMKGNRQQPQCGFSARVVNILEELGDDYQTYNMFSDPDIKWNERFRQWPTFPQLYIKQGFVGGCDLVTEADAKSGVNSLVYAHHFGRCRTTHDPLLTKHFESVQGVSGNSWWWYPSRRHQKSI